MKVYGVDVGDAVATIDAIGLLASAIAQVASASPAQADGAAGHPFTGLPSEEFPLLAQAAEAEALSDGRADVLSFAVDSTIAALEAKAPASGAMNEGISRTHKHWREREIAGADENPESEVQQRSKTVLLMTPLQPK